MLPGVLFVTVETPFFFERAVNRGHGKALLLIRMTLEAQNRDLLFYHQLLISRMRIVAGCTLGLCRDVHESFPQDIFEIRVTGETEIVPRFHELDRARSIRGFVTTVAGGRRKGRVLDFVYQSLLIGGMGIMAGIASRFP